MKNRYLFYKDRPEWADVSPVRQYDAENTIVKIAYTPEFVDANDYMRAVLLKDERSERALEITSTVLQLNPANYTVWEYRRRIMTTLCSDLLEELRFVGKLIDEHPKNYQLWHHRQWIVTQLSERQEDINEVDNKQAILSKLGSGELQFTGDVIADDSKNYHAWQHRRWVVNYFAIPACTELSYTELLIRQDVYNNSAWNHRFVTVSKDEGLSPLVLQRELEFVQSIIRLAPNNESSWNYLYGLLVPLPTVIMGKSRTKDASSRPDLVSSNTTVDVVNETSVDEDADRQTRLITIAPPAANLRMMRTFAEDLANSDTVAGESTALFGFLVEVYTDCIQARIANGSGKHGDCVCTVPEPSYLLTGFDTESDSSESLEELIDLAVSTCERLATVLDRIRATYWRYRSRQLQLLAHTEQGSPS